MTETIPENWERAETNLGVPYYIDHQSRKTYWDHPLFEPVIDRLSTFDTIKYSAYRSAAKIRILQKYLYFNHVRLGVVAGVFEQHGLSASENSTSLTSGHLEAILADIFFAAKTEVQARNGKTFDHQLATELALNLLLNTFDQKRKGTVKVMDVKVVLAILSCGLTDSAVFINKPRGREKWAQNRIIECYRYLFFQMSGGNEKLANRKSLSDLFSALATFVGVFLKEWRFFGLQFVPTSLYSCLQQGSDLMVSEDEFLNWLNSGPRLFAWFTTLHRMIAAESVKHDGVRCSLCKTSPIVGLRFRCLSCLLHDQCQNCFLEGKTNGRHKLNHPMYEYCLPTTGKEEREALIKTLKNKVRNTRLRISHSKERQDGSIWERRSVPYISDDENLKVEGNNVGETQELIQEMELTTKETIGKLNENDHEKEGDDEIPCPPKYPKEELSSIIGHLEEGNRDLGEQIEGLYLRERGTRGVGILGMCIGIEDKENCIADEKMCKQLQGAREQLEEQVKRLKALQVYLQKIQPSLCVQQSQYHRTPFHLESTPMPMPNGNRAYPNVRRLTRMEDLSPILARGKTDKEQSVNATSDAVESIGALLSKLENDALVECSEINSGVGNLLSPSICNLTEVTPQDLSTVLMARWRGGLKGFMGSSQVQSPCFPSSSILPSPAQRLSSLHKNEEHERQFQDVPGPLAEIQRDLDWVLKELDVMLLSQVIEDSSSFTSSDNPNTHQSEDPGDATENQKLCNAATQLEELLAGLIKVVEQQKRKEAEENEEKSAVSL